MEDIKDTLDNQNSSEEKTNVNNNADAEINEESNIDMEYDTTDSSNDSAEDSSEDMAEENNDKENELDIMRKLKDENKKLNNEAEALKERLLRLTAEYDNYRKRTSKEKEGIYTDACTDVLKEMIPVLDNLERAISVEGNVEDIKKGIEMTIKGFKTSFEKLGVEEIDASGEFDPNYHQAVMHIQDENLGANSIAEVFQKGYKRGDKVIRYTVVKVAN
ncbi:MULTISPECIES: nucleotide exchange factor GrpE [unclassified Clostridium]|uniref:nucleotide exchange factor GrpE n=1 Tax=unclassified Clostridium TaxID=2614128 RepID=UPI0025C04B54|nr:nucleotide exchange factor GrpE [Clostridium sp.]MDY4252921.1 nucleotide exchange factor GrpE [Clostridium sp.]